jgi:hypothetical protein
MGARGWPGHPLSRRARGNTEHVGVYTHGTSGKMVAKVPLD